MFDILRGRFTGGRGLSLKTRLLPSSFLVALCTAALNGGFLRAQQPGSITEPAFEVASLRPAHLTPGCFSLFPPGSTHYVVTCLTLRQLIAQAWKVHPDDVRGGDSQALDTAYDLSAVSPNGEPWTRDSVPPMLRNLLRERFHLAVHPGTKQVSGYILVVAKGGSKLTPAKSDTSQQGHKAGQPFMNSILPGYIRGRGIDLKTLGALLSVPAHSTVIDHTGITGVFDIDLHFATEDSSESRWPTFDVALEQQLGLQLQPQKITVDTLVIDHVDSEPTPN